MSGTIGARDRLATMPRPGPAARARAGWWLTLTDLLALMVASLVLLYGMGTPRLPAGFALPGALDAAPAADPFTPRRTADGAARTRARPALAAVTLQAAMAELGLAGVTAKPVGADGLVLSMPAQAVEVLAGGQQAADRLAGVIAAAGWRIREIIAASLEDAGAATGMEALARALGARRTAITLLPAAGGDAPPADGARMIWLRLEPGEAG